jgi:hypothetical protein
MQYPKNWGYGPFARAQCRRCGHYDTDLGMPTMSCEPTAPRTEPAPAGEQQ